MGYTRIDGRANESAGFIPDVCYQLLFGSCSPGGCTGGTGQDKILQSDSVSTRSGSGFDVQEATYDLAEKYHPLYP